jgi:cytochrome c-type biogenesis protein
MPSVQRAHDTLKGKDVVVLAIAIDGTGGRAVKPYLVEHGYTIPALLDPHMETARAFGMRAVPTTYVINRAGAIVAHGIGMVDFESSDFVQYLEGLLAQPTG